MKRVFPVFYFPPVSWFAAAIRGNSILLDCHVNYRKQQLYNRMRIQGPNKIQPLSITVERTGENTPIHESKIHYVDQNWQKNHWKSLESSYRRSPYFEYYEDEFAPFYEERTEKLLNYNLEIIKTCFRLLEVDMLIELSDSYPGPDDVDEDYRRGFSRTGKFLPSWYEPVAYGQVFRSFEPDLSIMDLLCNEGPAARQILQQSFREEK